MIQKTYLITLSSFKRLSCLIFFISFVAFSSCQKQINYQPQIDALKSSITSLQNQCDSLSLELTQTTSKLTTLTTNVSNLSNSIDSIKTQLTSIQSQITQLNVQLTQNTANISSIQTQIAQLTTQYQALLTELNSILNELSTPALSILNGLIAYYPFTGNAADSSGNGNNGTVNGATLTTDRFGKLNCAYSFNGVSNYIGLPVLTSLENSSKMTFSTWIKTNYVFPADSISHTAYIFSQWDSTVTVNQSNDVGLNIGVWSTGAYTTAFLSGTQIVTNGNLISANTWANLIIVYDGTQSNLSQRLAVYINGVFSAYVGNSNVPAMIGNLADRTVIGAVIGTNLAVGHPNTIGYYYSGQLDDIRIYNRTLSTQEIQYIASH
jgi:flagellar biosynthesis chaperone FliJ